MLLPFTLWSVLHRAPQPVREESVAPQGQGQGFRPIAQAAEFAQLHLTSRTLARACARRAVLFSTAPAPAEGRPHQMRSAVRLVPGPIKCPTLNVRAACTLACSGCLEMPERTATLCARTPAQGGGAWRNFRSSRGRRLFSETACREGRPAVRITLL